MKITAQSLAPKLLIKVGVEPSDSILTVKQKIQDVQGISPVRQSLFLGNKALDEDGRTLADYGILKDTTLGLHVTGTWRLRRK